MLLLVFLCPGTCAVFGLDWGSEYIKTAIVLSGESVHIALNQDGKRLSAPYFAFWNTTDPRNSAHKPYHWSLDDLPSFSWSFLDSAKSASFRFPDIAVKAEPQFFGTNHGFTKRETFALTLRHVISTADDGKAKPDSAKIVYVVEPLLPREQRFALLEATWLANASVTGIIDSPTAAANLYALERKAVYAKQPKLIMFVDVGARNTWISLFRFEMRKGKPRVTQLSLATKDGFGGNLIDELLTEHLLTKYAFHLSHATPAEINVFTQMRHFILITFSGFDHKHFRACENFFP